MRSVRTILLALAALAVTALAAPAIAAAEEWTVEGQNLDSMAPIFTDEGFPVKTGAGNVAVQGAIRWQGGNGGVECTLVANATFGANSGIGSVTEASISPASCKGLGGQGFCTVESATTGGLPWGLAAAGSSISTGATVTFKFKSFAWCPVKEDTYSGGFSLIPDNVKAMSAWTPSGVVNSTFSGSVGVSGKLNLTPAGRYGIGKTVAVGLSGTLAWADGMRSISCQVTADQALTAGGTGLVKSLKASSCSTGGSWTCSANSLTQNGQAWPIQNEGVKVKIENVSFTVGLSGCFYNPGFQVVGTLFETPAGGEVGAINKAAISGTTETRHNGINIGGSWTGSLNWSPAGVYGL